MKNCLHHIVVMALMMVSMTVWADEQPRDTVYFYDTWEQMLNHEPSVMLLSPVIEAETPYAIDIYTTSNDYHLYKHMTAAIGDSIWLMSSEYLKKFNNNGDANRLDGFKFIPVFFNEKIAFLTYVGYGDNLGLKDILFGDSREFEDYADVVDYYYIDFFNNRLVRVTPEGLIGLLEDYHDLLVRYEGMKDYKKRPIIEDFFFQFVDRATADPMRPYILDLVK